MYAIDFEYDGQKLSDWGYLVCNFNPSSGANGIEIGSNITFNMVTRNQGKKYSLTSTQYDEYITAVFDICKDPEVFTDYPSREITSAEFRDLERWLSRREFLTFRIIDKDHNNDTIYFEGSFNLEKIVIAEKLYGIELSLTTNSPFGHGSEQQIQATLSSGGSFTVTDRSDEIGHIYPNMSIYCRSSGDLQITNKEAGTTTLIQNVVSGETITIDGNTLQISTSETGHKIYNDFNYEFPQLVNSYSNRTNTFSSTLQCTITLTYTPYIKDFA